MERYLGNRLQRVFSNERYNDYIAGYVMSSSVSPAGAIFNQVGAMQSYISWVNGLYHDIMGLWCCG